jgi:hypothetical protein
MCEVTAFKRGIDLEEEARTDEVETVSCVDCGKVTTAEEAYDSRWQLDPVVCPDCLRWTLTEAGECCVRGVS